MRRGAWFLLLGVLAAVLGAQSARASGVETTGTTATTTTTTTGTPTTSTTTTSYAPLPASSLPAGCVGAGAAALVPPAGPVVALGTPASHLGASAYPASAAVVAFDSSTVSGSACRNTKVTLASVSLFGGAVTASSVEATDGHGTAAGVEIGGTAVSAAAGQTLPVEGWGQLTFGETVGRVTAPLVLHLLQARDGLAAGTRIAVAFAAAAKPAVKPSEKHRSSSMTPGHATPSISQRHARDASTKKHHRRRPSKPPPDFPLSTYPFVVDGGGLAPGLRHDPVVSTAMRFLGVPYQWGGASPATGFDCSGLVQYVFAKLGVSLVHYAAAQWDYPDSVWVAPNRLQEGDLVFFTGSDGTRAAPGHVGIYVDDGYFIDAPHTGSFVRIDRLSEHKFANEYVGARRIVSPLHITRHQPGMRNTASAMTMPPGFAPPFTIGGLGQSSGIGAADTTPVPRPSHEYWIWILDVLLFLLLA